MAWQKYSKYISGAAWIALGFGTSCAYAYPHTLGLEIYKETMTDKSKGSSQNTDAEADIANQIKKHFKWQKSFRSLGPDVQFIETKQLLDLSHIGSTMTIWGAVVGFPILFTASSIQTAQENPVAYLQRYNINVDLNKGQQILDLYTLSPAAKKFVLARELCHIKTAQLYITFYGINVSFFSFFALGEMIPKVLSFPGAVVISLLTVVPLLGYIYVKVFDYYNCHIQAKSDRMAASIDQNVADGGVEYYTTLIAIKQAFDELQKQDMGEVHEQPSSDAETRLKLNMSWRKPELSLEERKALLIQASQKLYQ